MINHGTSAEDRDGALAFLQAHLATAAHITPPPAEGGLDQSRTPRMFSVIATPDPPA